VMEPKPCVFCGECCKTSACGFGEWDEENNQCAYLVPFYLSEVTLYRCGIIEEIIKDPTSSTSPAFGAGCCRTLCNEARNKIIKMIDKGILLQ
jgi:hypothetical protein